MVNHQVYQFGKEFGRCEQRLDSIESRLTDIQSSLAAVLREVGMHDNAQHFIEKAHGPNCALCGQRSRRSHRTDCNVHSDCWRREKTDE